MLRLLFAALLFFTPAQAFAQIAVVTSPVDLSAMQAQITAVQATASAACQPLAQTPPVEAIGGAPGSGDQCRLANAVQPRISRSVSFTTGSGGTATVSWTDMGSAPLLFVVPNVASGATQAPMCLPVTGTITSTGATVKCFTTQSVTVSLLGAVVAPLTTAGSGVTGQVLAIPAS